MLRTFWLGASLTALPCVTWAQCSTSLNEQVCSLLRQGDELHRNAAEGPAGVAAHAAALERFREAARGMGPAMHHAVAGRLAQELVETGQLDEALLATQECLAQAESDLEHPARAEEECRSPRGPSRRTCQTWTVCRRLADEISARRTADGTSARYGTIRVLMNAPPSGTHVFVGGNDLPISVGSTGFPVVPGTLLVEVEATGFRRFSRPVQIRAGESVQVHVTLDAVPRGARAPTEEELTLGPAREVLQRVTDAHNHIDARFQRTPSDRCLAVGLDALDGVLLRMRTHYGRVRGAQLSRNAVRFREEMERLRRTDEEARSAAAQAEHCSVMQVSSLGAPETAATPREGAPRVHPLTIALLGAGGTGLLTSAVLFGVRASVIADLDGMCQADRSQCPATAMDLHDQGVAINTAGNATLLAGAGIAVAGGVSLMVDMFRSRAAPAPVTVWASPGAVGVSGRF